MQFKQGIYKHIKGFNLIELLVVIALIGIFLTLALPSFSDSFKAKRLDSVGDNANYLFKLARSSAAKKNRNVLVFVKKSSSTSWCIGLSGDDDDNNGESDVCDCTSVNSCTVDNIELMVSSDDYADIKLDSHNVAVGGLPIQATRGRSDGVTIAFSTSASSGNKDLNIVRSTLGRVTICSPSGNSLRFDKC